MPAAAPLSFSERRYAAFVSYRHADNKEPGRQWAIWVHQLLEGYDVPADLVGRKSDRGTIIPETLYPVFRDEEELPADADLTRNIRRALERSDLLVVICSPRAVQSTFVAEEIRYFKELGKADMILALMVDGEPNASEDLGKRASGIMPEQECLPHPLRYGVVCDGRVDWTRRTEPIAADVRPEGMPTAGWTSAAAYRDALRSDGRYPVTEVNRRVEAYDKTLELAKLKLIAGALGVPLGLLTKRDKAMQLARARQRAKLLRRWLAAVALLAMAAMVVGFYATFQRREAINQRDLVQTREAQQRQSLHEASMSDYGTAQQRLSGDDTWHEGVAYLARALDLEPDNRLAAARLYSTLSQLDAEKHALPTRLFTHNATVNDATFSPDAKTIATASDDQTVRFWDAETGAENGNPLTHTGKVEKVFFTPDGKKILSVSKSTEPKKIVLRVWNRATREPITHPTSVTGPIKAVVFLMNGARMLTTTGEASGVGGLDETRLWDVGTGQQLGPPISFDSGALNAVPVSFDGAYLLHRSDESVVVRSVANGAVTAGPFQHAGKITDARFSGDGTKVVTASNDGTVRTWNRLTGKLAGHPLSHRTEVSVAIPNVDGSKILTVSTAEKPVDDEWGATAQLWDAISSQPVGPATQLRDKADLGSQLVPGGSQVFVNNKSGPVFIDAATGRVTENVAAVWLLDICFSPDGSRFLSTKESGADSTLWAMGARPEAENLIWSRDIDGLGFSEDGTRILAGQGNRVQLYDGQSGQRIGTPLRVDNSVVSARLNAHGTNVVITCADKSAYLFDVPVARCIGEPLPHKDVRMVQFSPEGSRILTANIPNQHPQDRTIPVATAKVWDVQTHVPKAQIEARLSSKGAFGFSRSGAKIISILSDKSVGLWASDTGQSTGAAPMRHARDVLSVTFSTDDKTILTACADGKVRVWNSETGVLGREAVTVPGEITAATFTPDAAHVVVTRKNVTEIWSVASGQRVGEPMIHDEAVVAVVFSPDSTIVATVSGENGKPCYVRLWNLSNGSALSRPLLTKDLFRWRAGFAHDSSKVLLPDENGKARTWTIVRDDKRNISLRPENLVKGDGAIEEAQFSPNDAIFITSGLGTNGFWDAHTGQPLGEPIRHGELSFAYSAQFSPDGSHLLTTGDDNAARLLDISELLTTLVPVPQWVRNAARAVAGLEFTAEGTFRNIPISERFSTITQKHESGSPWDRLFSWIPRPRLMRSVGPASRFFPRQMVENERQIWSLDTPRRVLHWDATWPLARLLLAGAEPPDTYRAKFLRNYDLQRLPDDARWWAIASELLLQQKQTRLAVQAAQKAIALNKDLPAAQQALEAATRPSTAPSNP